MPDRGPNRTLLFGHGRLDLSDFVAAHPLVDGQPLRADPVATSADATLMLVQVATAEMPHLHATHDVVVTVLRGRGRLHVGTEEVGLTAGDVAQIPRGQVHWFAREGEAPAVALATFVPGLSGPDNVPAR